MAPLIVAVWSGLITEAFLIALIPEMLVQRGVGRVVWLEAMLLERSEIAMLPAPFKVQSMLGVWSVRMTPV